MNSPRDSLPTGDISSSFTPKWRVLALLGISVGLTLAACSGGAENGGANEGGDSSTGGAANSGGSGGATSSSGGSTNASGGTTSSGGAPSQNLTGWTECPQGFDALPGGADEFAPYAGEYTITWDESVSATNGNCGLEGVQLIEGETSSLVLSASAPQITITTGDDVWSQAWDDDLDLACAGSVTTGLELDDGSSFARLAVLGDRPHSILLGLCSGDLEAAP